MNTRPEDAGYFRSVPVIPVCVEHIGPCETRKYDSSVPHGHHSPPSRTQKDMRSQRRFTALDLPARAGERTRLDEPRFPDTRCRAGEMAMSRIRVAPTSDRIATDASPGRARPTRCSPCWDVRGCGRLVCTDVEAHGCAESSVTGMCERSERGRCKPICRTLQAQPNTPSAATAYPCAL